MPGSSPFLDSISAYMALRRYSKRTVEAYLYWIRYYIVYSDKRHPAEMGAAEVERFLPILRWSGMLQMPHRALR